jgi:nucleoside 2-deoxyribosyltransferase
MTFYLAAKYDKREQVGQIAEQLRQYGHTVISRWLTGTHDGLSPAEQMTYAKEDLRDILDVDCLVLFQLPEHDPVPSTGRHVEFGYALALRKKLIIVGNKTSVFHHLEEVEHYTTVEAFLVAQK